jgi:hypothetical protein
MPAENAQPHAGSMLVRTTEKVTADEKMREMARQQEERRGSEACPKKSANRCEDAVQVVSRESKAQKARVRIVEQGEG